MAVPKSRVTVRRIYLPDAQLQTTRVRGIGFRATCSCGWMSRTLRSYGAARSEGRAHGKTHELPAQLTLAGPL